MGIVMAAETLARISTGRGAQGKDAARTHPPQRPGDAAHDRRPVDAADLDAGD